MSVFWVSFERLISIFNDWKIINKIKAANKYFEKLSGPNVHNTVIKHAFEYQVLKFENIICSCHTSLLIP